MSTIQHHHYRRNAPARTRVIAHVIDRLSSGGTERKLVDLLGAFDPQRFRHVVVTMRDPGRLASELPDHAACRPLFARGQSRHAGVRLAATLREVGADLVHARNTGCWFDASVARVLNPRAELVLGYHGSQTIENFGSRLRRKVRLGLMVGGHFASVSGAGGRQLRDRVDVPTRRIDVLQNGVDLQRFANSNATARREAREGMQIEPGDLVVGCVGSLTAIKRQGCLLEAFAEVVKSVPAAKLMLVGDGPLRDELQAHAGDLGVGGRVVFTWQQSDVAATLRSMDIYVCCSAVEGISNAMLEAMASGLPVITTDVGDHGLIVRDGVEGRVIAVGATRELGIALIGLAGDADLRLRWGKASQRRAAAFSFERTVRTYEAFYERMLWRRSSPQRGLV